MQLTLLTYCKPCQINLGLARFFSSYQNSVLDAFLGRTAPCYLGRHLLTQKHLISHSLAIWRYFTRPQYHCAATTQIRGREAISQIVWVEHRANSLLYVMGRREQFLIDFFSPWNFSLSNQWKTQRWDLIPFFSVEAHKVHCLKYIVFWLQGACTRNWACAYHSSL